MVIGRKNHYGSRSQRGTEVAALFYSLIESAKLCGVEPKAYLLGRDARSARESGNCHAPARAPDIVIATTAPSYGARCTGRQDN